MGNLSQTVVKHLCYKKGWNDIKPKNPITLIIGSFNPYIPTNKFLPDYYYGRIPTRGPGNRLWSTIGKLKYDNKDYFKNHFNNKINELEKSNFYFLDLITKVEFTCENKILLNKYISEKVFKNFGDDILWNSRTKYQGQLIKINRTYNTNIIKFLSNYNSVKTVINTLGSTRGNFDFNKNDLDWIKFKNNLFEICSKKGIEIILKSVSPSPLGGSNEEFEDWFKRYI
tara:strand:+ start:250 stop:930 length:681 start_codon:yes stop_codon:yes gene_type:complete